MREAALNIIWHDQFRYGSFPSSGAEQKRLQRRFIYNMIQNHTLQPSNGNGGTPNHRAHKIYEVPAQVSHLPTPSINNTEKSRYPLKRPRVRPRARQDDSDSSDEETLVTASKRNKLDSFPKKLAREASSDLEVIASGKVDQSPSRTAVEALAPSTRLEGLSPLAISETVLLVSASNQPTRAPANVPLCECGTLLQLFQTLIIECNLRGEAASELSEVSATYTWDQKQHLIRKDKSRDWKIFCEAIRKAWGKHASQFAED